GRFVMAAEPIDVQRLGERLRSIRKVRDTTLQEVAAITGVSIPTLSRMERGGCKEIDSSTFVALTNWIGAPAEEFRESATLLTPPAGRRKVPEATPDIIELYLRADKN